MTVRFLLLNAYTVGGTVRTVYNQANTLAAAGHDVEIASVWRQRKTSAFRLDPRVRLRPLVDTTDETAGWRRRLELRARNRPSRLVPPAEVRYDRFNRLTDRRIVHYLRSLDGGLVVGTRPALNLLVARHAPASVVTVGQEHLHYARHKPELARELDRHYRDLHALCVLTAADEADYRRVLEGSGVRIARIPNSLAETGPARSPLDRPVVVAAGRLVKSKGFHTMIEAFAHVAHDHPEWQLRIFGAGPERDRLRKLVEERRLTDNVHLRGVTDHLDEELAQASAFALSSRHEGFGMVLAEAMSHGVPVVSFDCPVGPREIITDGHDGLLVPMGDNAGLAVALNRLIEDPRLRRTLGENAVVSARRYSAEEIGPQWESLFAELLEAKHGSAAAGLTT